MLSMVLSVTGEGPADVFCCVLSLSAAGPQNVLFFDALVMISHLGSRQVTQCYAMCYVGGLAGPCVTLYVTHSQSRPASQ